VFILVFFGDFLDFFMVFFVSFVGFFVVFFVDFLGDVSNLVDVCVLDFLDCDVVFRVLLGLGLVELLHDCSQ
jgi:uncharacterized membrane protein YjjP (DUF1212 family)